MQQGEFCLMDFFYLRSPAPIFSLPLFGLLFLCYRTLAFSLFLIFFLPFAYVSTYMYRYSYCVLKQSERFVVLGGKI